MTNDLTMTYNGLLQTEDSEYVRLVSLISERWETAKEKAAHAVNTELIDASWETGRYIVEFEQGGNAKARYGEQLITNLAKDLTRMRGRGVSRSNLIYMRKFYLSFPKSETLSHQLTWVEDLFYKYIDFLKDIYLGQGSLDDSKEDNLKKLSKIELTYPDGHQEVLTPLDALRKAVNLIGPDKVSKMNLKVVNDKLIQHYEPAGNKYFESIGDGWWLNTRGTPKSKYQCVRIMLSRANLSIIAKLY